MQRLHGDDALDTDQQNPLQANKPDPGASGISKVLHSSICTIQCPSVPSPANAQCCQTLNSLHWADFRILCSSTPTVEWNPSSGLHPALRTAMIPFGNLAHNGLTLCDGGATPITQGSRRSKCSSQRNQNESEQRCLCLSHTFLTNPMIQPVAGICLDATRLGQITHSNPACF